MVPEVTDINDASYLLPHAMFFSFQDPCSFKTVHYNASSYSGEHKWYVNNVCASEGGQERFVYCAPQPGNYQVKMVAQTFQVVQIDPCTTRRDLAWNRVWATVDGGETGNETILQDLEAEDLETYLNADSRTNVLVAEYRPTFSVQASEPANTQSNRDIYCYSQGEEVTVTPSITLAMGQITDYVLDYTLTDPNGQVVQTESFGSPTSGNQFNFNILQLGTYKVTAVLTDTICNKTYTRELDIETCDFVVVESSECGKFQLYNLSTQYDISYVVRFVNGTTLTRGTLEKSDEGTTLGRVFEYDTEELGIHFIDIEYLEDDLDVVTRTYVINNLCELWDCLASYVNGLICNDPERCAPCGDETLLNEMVLINMTYSMLMNKEYSFNNFYSLLDESALTEYQSINTLATKIKELCNKINCGGISTDTTNPTQPFSFGTGNCSGNCSGCGNGHSRYNYREGDTGCGCNK
jgi:hypothetical protein